MKDIRTIEYGEKITAPGAYRMSMDWYHADCCAGPSISSSGLRKITLGSPHAFWMQSDWNPNRYPPKEPNDGMILGRAAHALMLGDEVFDDLFIYVPEDAPRRPTAPQLAAFERDGAWSDAAAPGAAFWEAFDARAAGRMTLSPEQVKKIGYMAENLRLSSLAVEVLTSDLTEISMVWQDEITGLWVKSRPDCIPSNGYDFGDLKTFAPKSSDMILSAQRAITDHGYAQQMALAIEGAERVLDTSATRCALVFIQTTEPYEVVPIEIDDESLYWARVLNRAALDAAAHGLKTGKWPFASEWIFGGQGIVTYSYPPFALSKFGTLQLDGSLPNLERNAA